MKTPNDNGYHVGESSSPHRLEKIVRYHGLLQTKNVRYFDGFPSIMRLVTSRLFKPLFHLLTNRSNQKHWLAKSNITISLSSRLHLSTLGERQSQLAWLHSLNGAMPLYLWGLPGVHQTV